MPNWRKVIVSGSDAALNSLNVTAGITGSLLGTASFASTASYVNPLTQDVIITGSLTLSGSDSPLLSLPDAPQNAAIISGSSGTTSVYIYDSVDGLRTPTYDIGAGLRLVSGEGTGQATLDVSAVGSDNGGSSNEQAFIRSNQMLSLYGEGNAAGDNIRFRGSFGYVALDSTTAGTSLTFVTNGGSTPSTIALGTTGGSGGVQITTTAAQSYLRFIQGSNTWLDLTSTKATFLANVSSSAASTASFGHYIGDGSEITGVISSSYAITSSLPLLGFISASTVGAQLTLIRGDGTSQNLTLNTGSVNFATSASYAATASFITASNVYGPYGLNSIISSSWAETSSYADTAFSALNTPFAVITASNADANDTIEFLKGGGATFAVTVNNVQNSVSSSYASTASYALPLVQDVTITGSIFLTSSYIAYPDYIDFNTTGPEVQPSVGRLSWNQDDLTLDLGTGDGDTTIQIGQETVYPLVFNADSIDLVEGTLVMIDPSNIAQGNKIRVVRSITNGTYPSQYIVGVLTEDIAQGADGFATWFGKVRNLNIPTLESAGVKPVGEAWAEGDVLYPNPAVSGGLTFTAPSAPNINGAIAVITAINDNSLTMLVRPTLTFTLTELTNVATSGSTDGDLLVKSGSLWVSGKQLSGSYGITGSLSITGSLFVKSQNSVIATNYPNSQPGEILLDTDSGNATKSFLFLFDYVGSDRSFGELSAISPLGQVRLVTDQDSLGINVNRDFNAIRPLGVHIYDNPGSTPALGTGTYINISGSNIENFGDVYVTGSLITSGSNSVIGPTQLTGSLNITGSLFVKSQDTIVATNYPNSDPGEISLDTDGGSFNSAYVYLQKNSGDPNRSYGELSAMSPKGRLNFMVDQQAMGILVSKDTDAIQPTGILLFDNPAGVPVLQQGTYVYISGSKIENFGDVYVTGSLTVSSSLEVIGSQIISGTLKVHGGNVDITSNAYFFQGTNTSNVNVSLIGVNNQDQVYIGNQGYTNILADETHVRGNLQVTGSLLVTGSTNLNGSLTTKTTRITASSYTASINDYRIAIRYTDTGSVSVQLPLISQVGQIEYRFKDEEGNATVNPITLVASGSNLIDGSSTALLKRNYIAVSIYNDGVSNWYIE